MNWIALSKTKKDPLFDVQMLVLTKHGDWHKAFLKEIKHQITGKQYLFSVEELPDVEDATHFMYIELPKE